MTSLSAVVGNLGPGSKYLIRAKYTDAANDVAYSDVLTVSTLPAPVLQAPLPALTALPVEPSIGVQA